MIETERLILRKMAPDDVDDLLEIFSDPKVMASFDAAPFTREQMVSWVERNLEHQRIHGYGLFSVMLKSDGSLIGDCGLEHMKVDGEAVVELGYDIGTQYWNRGFATEAASAVRDYAFGTLGLKRLVSLIRIRNVASKRVSEKIGMAPCRTLVLSGNEYVLYAVEGVLFRSKNHGTDGAVPSIRSS